MSILSAEDVEFFRTNGYIRIPELIPRADCEAVIDAMWTFLGQDRNNPDDWYRPPLLPGGMIEMYQHQAMWNTRQNPRLHEAFSDLFGTEKLWVSIDRVNLKPPRRPDHPEYDHKGFTHWDTDSRKLDGPLHVQGVLYLADTGPNQGGFQCVPELFRNMREWVKTQPADRNPHLPDLTGFEVTPVPGKAGDFLIWNSLLAHGNGQNLSDQPRYAQFISMGPAQPGNTAARDHRVKCWQERQPPGPPVFPGDPREVEQRTQPTATLTPLGRKLLGVDNW